MVISSVPPPGYVPVAGEVNNFDYRMESEGWCVWPEVDNAESVAVPLGRLTLQDGIEPRADGVCMTLRSYLPCSVQFEVRYGDYRLLWSRIQELSTPRGKPIDSTPVTPPLDVDRASLCAGANVGIATLPMVLELAP